jgi:hypothetical protein
VYLRVMPHPACKSRVHCRNTGRQRLFYGHYQIQFKCALCNMYAACACVRVRVCVGACAISHRRRHACAVHGLVPYTTHDCSTLCIMRQRIGECLKGKCDTGAPHAPAGEAQSSGGKSSGSWHADCLDEQSANDRLWTGGSYCPESGCDMNCAGISDACDPGDGDGDGGQFPWMGFFIIFCEI